MEKVLVTGLFTQAALFAVRRLAALGYAVTAADGHRLAFGMYSKYVTRRILLPDLRTKPAAYAGALLAELSNGAYDYYFPSFEEIFLLAQYRDRLPSRLKTLIPSYRQLMAVHDKSRLRLAAAEAGVPMPETFAPRSQTEAENAFSTIDYPVVIKLRQTLNSCGLVVVDDPKRLPDQYRRITAKFNLPDERLPLIQRWVDGPLICSLELAQDGRVLGQALCRGIRTMPRLAGTTVARVSVREAQCEALSAAIIGHMRWTGFIGFDYIMDRITGRPFMLDCNPRTSTNLILGYHGGVDMVSAWLLVAENKRAESLPACAAGIKTKVHFADVIWYFDTMFHGPESKEERRRMRRNWRRDKGYFYDILDFRDLGPQLMLYLYILYQTPRLFSPRFEANQLMTYYNQYVEENLHRASEGAPTEAPDTP